MFSRIYSGIVLSLLTASVVCYAVYAWSFSLRYPKHEDRAVVGMLRMVSVTMQTQSESTRQRYLGIVSELLDAGRDTVEIASLGTVAREMLADGNPVRLEGATDGMVWCLPLDASRCEQLSIAPLSEQHYRAMAILFVSAMSRKNTPDTVESLQPYSPFPLARISLERVPADAQQRSRLRNGSVVLISDPDSPDRFSVYAPLSETEALGITDIRRFDPFPVGLAIGLLVLLGGIIAFACYALVRQLERELKHMSHIVTRFGDGALAERIPRRGDDAVSRLGEQFNTMAAKIEHLVNSERSFLRAVSHDLRTPLARMRFRLEAIEHPGSSQEQAAARSGLRADVGEVQGFIDELLDHHRMDATKAAVFGECEPDKVVESAVDAMAAQYPSTRIESSLQAAAFFELDQRLFRRLVSNLIENACKYSNGAVRVRTGYDRDTLVFEVEDDGPGVPPENRARVFETFYQIRDDQVAGKSGYGLGLTIVKKIVALHQGEIVLDEATLGGARFRVVLPAQRSLQADSTEEIS